jgi:L-fucose mutarotase
MLTGIPAILGPALLHNLRAMGHGDEIALVDANYPAQSDANGRGGLIRADGNSLPELLDAILTILPLDRSTPSAVYHATVAGDGRTLDPVHVEIGEICARRQPGHAVSPLAGADFYDRVRRAHTVVATGERRLYANVILRKGVIAP